jgi:hypothetical protein
MAAGLAAIALGLVMSGGAPTFFDDPPGMALGTGDGERACGFGWRDGHSGEVSIASSSRGEMLLRQVLWIVAGGCWVLGE